MKARKTIVIALPLLGALLPATGFGGVALLEHQEEATTGGVYYSSGDINYCPYQSLGRTLRVTYDYCAGSSVLFGDATYCNKNTGGPTPTCGNNPYEITTTLYRDGTPLQAASQQDRSSGAWGRDLYLNQLLTPGTYKAVATLKRRNGTCSGWVTVDTQTSNSIVVGTAPVAQCFGTPTPGTRVRLRNMATGKCMFALSGNGGQVFESDCWNNPAFTFVLDGAGDGGYRLRYEGTNQCLYTVASLDAYAYHWGCWADPNMVFGLIPTSGGYRLWSRQTGESLYSSGDGHIRSGADSSSSNAMVYFLDTVTMSGAWTGWLNRDNPGGNGDYETRAEFPAGSVCANPTAIICQTTTGLSPWEVGQGPTVMCDAAKGLVCINAAQPDGNCRDYQVKFYCP